MNVPYLQIASDDLWNAVKTRQAELQKQADPDGDKPGAFWLQQRPRYLLSGLCVCAGCEAGFSMISRTHMGCSNARNKGPSACTNRRIIALAELEAMVLDGLSKHLMRPDVYRGFVSGFTEEWNKDQKMQTVERKLKEQETKKVSEAIRPARPGHRRGALFGAAECSFERTRRAQGCPYA